MPLQSSGQISLNDLHVEAGGTSSTQCSMNDSDIRGLVSASANSQMTFSSFYGASAATTVLSGNSGYVAPGQYVTEQRALTALSPHTYNSLFSPSPRATSTTITINGRSTYVAHFVYLPSSNAFQLHMADLTGGVRNSPIGYPANSGWSTMTLAGNGGTQTLSRSAASYQGTVVPLYLNQGSTSSNYGGALWQWTPTANNPTQNILPASNNTTSFTLTIS